MSGTGFLVLANPDAGSADEETVGTVIRRLEQAAPVTWCDRDEDAEERALRDADGQVVVVIGGDGSIHRAAGRLHELGRLDLEVALVPLGTGNDLARGTGIPLDPLEAAAGLTGWAARPIDLLAGEEQVVVNAVHLGLGAHAAEHASRWKPRLGLLAYPLGAAVAATWIPPWWLQVSVDGRLVHEGMTALAGVGNGSVIGGGTPMFPRARPDDGQAEVLVAADRYGRAGRVAFGYALRRGRQARLPWVRTARGRHIEVSGEPVAGNADGEVWAARAQWQVEVLPGVLRLRRP